MAAKHALITSATTAVMSVWCVCMSITTANAAERTVDAPITLAAPPPDREIVAKKPRIEVAIGAPYSPESLQVLLDGADITALLEPLDGGFSYAPRQALPAGAHVLVVHLRTRAALDVSRELVFSTRHTEKLTELTSAVQLGLEGERLADRRAAAPPEPTYKGEGELVYGLHAQGRWDSRVDSNLWFQNQKLPVFAPPGEGLDLASLTLRTANTGERHAFRAEFGDVQIVGSNRSIASLARRGTNLGFDYRAFSIGGFAVNSRQVFGFTGGSGIGTDRDDNIYGVTTGFGLLDDKLRFRAIHARGGEPGSSFGLFTARGATRGQVTGYVLTAQPSPLLAVEAEYDESEFDADASDDVPGRKDDAYGLRLFGQKNAFNYQLSYERLGPDYAVVASPVNRDRENVAASGGFALAKHSLTVTALRQHDNVDGDPTRYRLGNDEGSFDYGYRIAKRWLVGADYRNSRVASSRGPLGFAPQELLTRGFTSRIQYTGQPWLLSLEVARSDQDDAFFDGNDSEVLTRSLSPSYQARRFSFVPMLSTSTTTFTSTGMQLEQGNLSLMLNGKTPRERFAYGLALSAYDQQTSDGTFDTDTQSAELRLSYRLRYRNTERPRGQINLRTTRLKTTDRITGAVFRDWAVWLTFSVSPRYVF